MQAPKFLVGQLANGERRWASIDPDARFTGSEIGETRFGGYLKPFVSEEAARDALLAAGASPETIAEERKRRRG